MRARDDPVISSADMFLLEHWNHDSTLSDDEQREKIFADFVVLDVEGQQVLEAHPSILLHVQGRTFGVLTQQPGGIQRYRQLKAQRGIHKSSSLSPSERQFLDRVRQPTERFAHSDFVSWLRTSYEPSPSTEAAFSAIASALQDKFGEDIILNDSRLYNFGDDWQRILLRAAQLLSVEQSVEYADADADADADGESESEYEFDYTPYHWAMVIGRIHIIDRITLVSPSEGQDQGPDAADAGKVLISWYDACGRVVRSYRDTVKNAADITAVDNAILDDNPSWLNGEVGPEYCWGAALGPPYGSRR
ncbi:hypothetical protein BJX62DRAFT_239486 [Aspergillus germanicus]